MTELKLPYSLDAERSVLGAFFIDPTLVRILGLEAEDFYRPAHRVIFKAMNRLVANGKPVELELLLDSIGEKQIDEAGGLQYLAEVAGAAATSISARHYSEIVQRKAAQRRVKVACSELLGMDGDDPDEWTDAQRAVQRSMEPTTTDMIDQQQRAKRWREKYTRKSPQFLPVPLQRWEEWIGGIPLGAQTVIGARPSMGKTALGLFLGLTLALAGIPVAYFSLESPWEQIHQRLIVMLSWLQGRWYDGLAIKADDLRSREADPDEVCIWSRDIAKLPIYVEDRVTSLPRLVSKARAITHTHGVQGIFLDLVGKVKDRSVRGENQQRETIHRASYEFSRIAVECNVATILMAHLNRQAQGVLEPTLAHLRMAGDLENDADLVVMMARETMDTDWGKFTVRKNRDGRADMGFRYAFLRQHLAFGNFTTAEGPE